MNVLFLHANQPDYLVDGLFHGLRTLLGNRCVDVPRYDSLYSPLTDGIRRKLRGNGFTLYGLLQESDGLAEKRFYWRKEAEIYDLIVIANIWTMWPLAQEFLRFIAPERLAILDGTDSPVCFPYGRNHWCTLLFPERNLRRIRYFKRELSGDGAHAGKLAAPLPGSIRRRLPQRVDAREIAFSIPQEKIWRGDGPRPKRFTSEMVDVEAAQLFHSTAVAVGRQEYVYDTEEGYYADLRRSRFGVTTRRAGWDCLRHYEFAANGCVLCFRDLDRKPRTCAPHGLHAGNCIIYNHAEELRERTSNMSDAEYERLQANSYAWVEQNTTLVRAKKFLQSLDLSFPA